MGWAAFFLWRSANRHWGDFAWLLEKPFYAYKKAKRICAACCMYLIFVKNKSLSFKQVLSVHHKLLLMRYLLQRKYLVAVLSACVGTMLQAQVAVCPAMEELNRPLGNIEREEFVAPPKVFYPETWFHYIGGNVSLEGITADLEAIAEAGFAGIHLFHGQFGGVWPGTDSQIACLSPLWDNAVRHTATECQRLGLRFTMQGCPGWAMAGGPWITPENAMRHLVWSRTDVASGTESVSLPVPQPSAEDWRDYRDIAVLAFPTPEGDTGVPLVPDAVESNISCNWKSYLAGNAKEALQLNPVTDANPYWLEVEFPTEQVVRTIELPCVQGMNHGWCYDPGVRVKAEAILEDGTRVGILNTDLPQANWQDDRPVTLSCKEVKGAKKYRISWVNAHGMAFSSLRLFSAVRKNNWESEAGWTLRSIERAGDAYRYAPGTCIDKSRILDVTEKFDGKQLRWKVPSGQWTVLRIGHVNTGMKNGPAPAEGTGWECDKFSLAGSNAQFDGYIGRLTQDEGPLSGGLLKGILFDSWECKTQTWTKEMEPEFESRAHYPLRKWIPALFGYVIDDQETTFRFLNDWRNVLGGLLADNFYGNMKKRAEERGLSITYETSAGDVFPADILEYYKHADVPMCEFWQPMSDNYVGSLNFKPIKPAASAARLYGKPRVAAESFTSFAHTWNEHLQMLKEVANINMIEGVTHLVFHTYTHNPQVGFLPPGTSFSGAGIGTPFLRGQTWWKYMPEFTAYFARCGYLLERGKPVSDVLWYLGDETDHKPDQNAPFPKGYKYDYCNPDVLLNRLSVRDGMICTPEGVQYRVLWLADVSRMRPETMETLDELVKKGATVVGNPPQCLATLSGGKNAQRRFDKALKSIWGKASFKGIRKVGKGKVVSGLSLEEALRELSVVPDVKGEGALWLHRTDGNTDWYFVTVPQGKSFQGELSFRSRGHVEIWNPVTGEISPADYKADGDRTWVKLDLVASESCFVVFQKGAPGESYKEKRKVSTIPFVHDWILRYPEGWGVPESIRVSALKPWKDLDVSDEGKAFSGSVRYETQVDIAKEPGKQYVLDLGQVDMVASVSVNGKFVRNLWCAPYKVDVTCALQDGANTLSIEVTSTWFNRLVYDASLPEPERKTWALRWPSKDALLQPCGLMGPVEVTVWEERGTSVGR